MLDFTEQALSTESLPKLSVDTPIVSDSLLDTDYKLDDETVKYLTDLDTKAATEAALAPFVDIPKVELTFTQDEEEE